MIIKSENLSPNESKKRIIYLALFILACLFLLISVFRQSNFLSKKTSPVETSPVSVIEQEASKTSLLGDIANEATESAKEEVKVLPIVIVDNTTPETEEKAAQFALLKSKCPINEDAFNINFSYKNDKFDVLLVADKESEFWQWLAVNYPKLEKDSFIVAKL